MRIRPTDFQRPLLLFSNGIGDHFLNLPAVRAVVSLFGSRLTLACTSGFRRLFFADLDAHVVEAPFWSTGSDQRGFDADAMAERVEEADLVLSLNPWHSVDVGRLLSILRPRTSVGFFQGFDVVLPLDFEVHSADLAFSLVQALDSRLRIESFAGALSIRPEHAPAATTIRNQIPPSMRVLAVHADTLTEKMISREAWLAVLDAFLERRADFIALVVGEQDQALDSGRHGDRVIPCCGLPLASSVALVSNADLFVGIDSCMLHAADLARVPGVGLFGPTNPEEFGFRFARHRHVRFSEPGSIALVQRAIRGLEELAGAERVGEIPWACRTEGAS